MNASSFIAYLCDSYYKWNTSFHCFALNKTAFNKSHLKSHPKMMTKQSQDTHALVPILLRHYHLFRFACPFLF